MSRLSRVSCVLGLVLSVAPLLHAGSQANVPAWVKDLAAQPVGTYPPRTDAVVLLDETTISVTSPGEYLESNRRVVRILRPEGKSEGNFWVFYGKDEKVLSAHAWSIDEKGNQYEVKEKDFIDRGRWGDDLLYSDDRARTAEAPAAVVGSVVAVESSVRRRLWIAQPTWSFQEAIPVKEARFTLDLPNGWEYKAFCVRSAEVQPTQLGPSKWQWVRRDIPAITKEKLRPCLRALAGRMEFTYFAPGAAVVAAESWKSIGNWYNGLTSDRRNASPEIVNEVQRVTTGRSGFDPVTRALASFVQSEVRYVAVEIGIGAHQPHYAADIYKNRYGDCKDKATLLSTMLKVAGIRSYYVVVHSVRGVITADAPSMGFNHVILAIELPKDAPNYRSVITAKDGRRMLAFDATDPYTPFGELSGDLQGNVAMLVTETGGEAVTLPLLEPGSNVLARDGKFTLALDGTLTGEVVEKRTGDNAGDLRANIKRSDERERKHILEQYFGRFLNGATIHEANFDYLSDIDRELVLRYKIGADKYAQSAGPLLLVRPRVLGEKSKTLEWKDRKYPVVLGPPAFETDDYELALPDGLAVDDVPEPAQIDVGFASYKSKIDVVGSSIRYHREYVVKNPEVPLDKLADLKRLEQEIDRDENASVVLKKK